MVGRKGFHFLLSFSSPALGIEPRASSMLGKGPTSELQPSPLTPCCEPSYFSGQLHSTATVGGSSTATLNLDIDQLDKLLDKLRVDPKEIWLGNLPKDL